MLGSALRAAPSIANAGSNKFMVYLFYQWLHFSSIMVFYHPEIQETLEIRGTLPLHLIPMFITRVTVMGVGHKVSIGADMGFLSPAYHSSLRSHAESFVGKASHDSFYSAARYGSKSVSKAQLHSGGNHMSKESRIRVEYRRRPCWGPLRSTGIILSWDAWVELGASIDIIRGP